MSKSQIKYNNQLQYYKGVQVKLIIYTQKHFDCLKAKRFMLGDPKYNQNIWIPNCYLQQDGTIRSDVNIDFVFKTAYMQKKFAYADIDINPLEWR